jgi:hypothetical protein
LYRWWGRHVPQTLSVGSTLGGQLDTWLKGNGLNVKQSSDAARASDGSELGYIPVPANPTVTSVNITWEKINEDQQSE